MTRPLHLALLLAVVGVSIAACNGGSATLSPQPNVTGAPNATFPFLPLQFDVVTFGTSVTNGWQCPTGVLTSSTLLPSSRARRPFGVHVATGGCDASGFPVPSPLPTPPGPTPVPLATLTTQQIVAPGYTLRVPAVSGWNAMLTFPACGAGTCDAGTSNGAIALDVLPATSQTVFAFELVLRNSGPENLPLPTPSPQDRPAPHVYNLYGPPEPPGVPLQPVPVYVSGAPVTLPFPSLAVTLPPGSGLSASKLRLTIAQKLTPPTYEEAIYTSDFLAIPLVTSSAAYAPTSTNGATANFTLPATPFPFQTDFTEYDFTVAST